MKYAYARVSTEGQELERQIYKFKEVGIEGCNIFEEKITGTKKDRPMLQKLIEIVKEGDTIYIESLSRLARSTKDLYDFVGLFLEKGVTLISFKENIDLNTATGKMFFGIVSVLSEFERDLISERIKETLSVKKANGHKLGRPTSTSLEDNVDEIIRLKKAGYSREDIAKKYGVAGTTITRFIKRLREEGRYV